MDDFVKEPDKYDFVDSNHILNYLERTMEEECENSLMDSGGNTSDSTSYDGRMNTRLEATAGLLDNLIKTVCHGIDESTLIDKDDSVDSSATIEKYSSDGVQKSDPCQLKHNLEKNSKEKDLEVNLVSSDDGTESSTTETGPAERDDTKSIDISPEESEEINTCSSGLQEKEDNEILIISDEEGEDSRGTGVVEKRYVTEIEMQSSVKNVEMDNALASTSAKKDTQDHAFHINDNMKKGLSNLAFPSKPSSSRITSKKSILPPLRPKSNIRITIAEALEKAQDAQKIMNEKNSFAASAVANAQINHCSGNLLPASTNLINKYAALDNEGSHLELVKKGAKPESARTSDNSEKNPSSISIAESRSCNNSPSGESVIALENEAQELGPGKGLEDSDSVQGKSRSRAKTGTRFKLTPRMWELLRFTFDHEHFPSSVHMARLGKMMGITWSQIRNWFTNRRVENKKAGIFPRDKVLLYCPYCMVNLKTESEQKGHLFASQHVKKILGPEYVGQSDIEPIKWKQQSQDCNAESSKTPKDSVSDEEEDSESVTKNLGKRWKKSFLTKDGTSTLVEEPERAEAGHGKQSASESKIVPRDCGLDQIVKEEVMEEDSVDKPMISVDAIPVKTEGEENLNLDSYNSSLKTINSEKQFKCSADVQGDTPSCDTASYNACTQSSLEVSYDSSKSFNNTYSGCSPMIRRMSPTFMEPSNILNVGLRRRQRRIENNMQESTMGYQCPTCFKIFQTEWLMIKHSMTHLLFICDICGSIFPSEHILKLHLHDHLTGTYEEEKYYCQFSCKKCHSLKCECYEPLYYKPKETPKTYTRPQKAIRSKKTFSSKPYSGQNDHLRVTLGNYQKFMLQSSSANTKKNAGNVIKPVTVGKSLPQDISHSSVAAATPKQDDSKRTVESKTVVESPKQVLSSPTQPRLSVRKDLLEESPEKDKTKPDESWVSTTLHSKSGVSNSDEKIPAREEPTTLDVNTKEVKENEPPRKGRGRPAGRKNGPKEKSSAYVYSDGDFYYMCETVKNV